MRKKISVGIAALALGGSIAIAPLAAVPASASPAASADSTRPNVTSAWKTKTITATWCLGDSRPKLGGMHGSSCFLANEQVTVMFAYNGNAVWGQFKDCKSDSTWPYSVSERWCGYWNNGGANYEYMNAGANFNVHHALGSYNHYIRINCDRDGRVWLEGA